MPTLDELMSELDGAGFEWDGLDGFKESMRGTFDSVTAGANASIEKLEAENAKLAAQLKDTQAVNYRLMIASTAPVGDNSAHGGDDGDEDVIDIKSLIKEGRLG